MSHDPSEAEEAARNLPEETSAPTRRSFLKGVGLAGVAASLAPVAGAESVLREHAAPIAPAKGGAETSDPASSASNVSSEEGTRRVVRGTATTLPLALKVNGESVRATIDPRASLLDTLRESLHLTGTKKGCDHGQCGACTIHIDGKRALSCLTLALSAQGHEITTIEGLGTPERMHPMQAAFVKHDSYQCGYCTSGQIMSAVALAGEPIGPEDADVKEAMSGNICRCGAYANITDAIQEVRRS